MASRVPNNWTYEQEMREREERRVCNGEENQCGIIGNPDFAGRCCPADGISKCADCPLKD